MSAEQVAIPQTLLTIETQTELYVVIQDEGQKVLLHGHGIEKRGQDPDWRLPGGLYVPNRGTGDDYQLYCATGGLKLVGRAAARGPMTQFDAQAEAVYPPDANLPVNRIASYFHLAVSGIEPDLGLKLPYRQFRWMRMEHALGSLSLPGQQQALQKYFDLQNGTWGNNV